MNLLPKKGILRLLGLLFGLYVLANMTLIALVPILHKVSIDITVLDTRADLPLQDVNISWVNANPSMGFSWSESVGTTDKKGRLTIDMTVQEQPLWVFPMVGWFKFNNRTLRLTKEGYDEETLDLSKDTSLTAYGTHLVSITVKMKSGQGR